MEVSLLDIVFYVAYYNSYIINFILNWERWQGSIGLSILFLPLEIIYIVSFIIGFAKKKSKLIIMNLSILALLFFIIVYNRIKVII